MKSQKNNKKTLTCFFEFPSDLYVTGMNSGNSVQYESIIKVVHIYTYMYTIVQSAVCD